MISFLQMSLWGAALTVIICAVRTFFGSRLPRRTFRILWAVVILRMLIPFSLPVTKINTGVTVPKKSSAVQDVTVYTCINSEFGQTGSAETAPAEAVYEVSETYDKGLTVSDIRLLISAAVFVSFAAAHLRFRFKVGDAVLAERLSANFKRRVRIKTSDRIDSPLTYGIFRPVILIPKSIFSDGSKQYEYILAHELTHIKRFDVLYKLLAVLAASLHWFNPFAWVMLVLANRDIELSCDEEVILAADGVRGEYAMTLIGMEERRSFGVLQSGFGGSYVKERIKSVMTVKKPSPAGKAAAALLVAAAFAVFTVYDIERDTAYSVTVTADSSDTYYNDPVFAEVSYTAEEIADDAAVTAENIAHSFNTADIAVRDTVMSAEEVDRAFNSSDIAVEYAPFSTVETDSVSEGTADTEIEYSILVTSVSDEELAAYPEDYSLYKYGYADALTGELTVITIDLNKYSPFDHEKYGLTISPDKGYYIYNGIPVAGFQCTENTLIDNVAIKDGGGFFIYKEEEDSRFDETTANGMVQVNTAQFFDITGMH